MQVSVREQINTAKVSQYFSFFIFLYSQNHKIHWPLIPIDISVYSQSSEVGQSSRSVSRDLAGEKKKYQL